MDMTELLNSKLLRSIFNNWLVEFIFFGSGLLAFIKVTLILNGMRIFSFIRAYKNKKKYFQHDVFKNIDRLLKGSYISTSILDNSSTHILPATTAGASANGVYTGSSAPQRFIASGYFTDGANGTPRVDNETRSKNYSVLKQIVRG